MLPTGSVIPHGRTVNEMFFWLLPRALHRKFKIMIFRYGTMVLYRKSRVREFQYDRVCWWVWGEEWLVCIVLNREVARCSCRRKNGHCLCSFPVWQFLRYKSNFYSQDIIVTLGAYCWISSPCVVFFLNSGWLVQYSCSGSNFSPKWLIQFVFLQLLTELLCLVSN